MFSNSHQSGFISIFFSVGSNPLALWDKQVKNGHIRRVIDDEVKSLVLDIGGTNVATTYITCPIKPRASLGVKLPYFVMVIKNMKKYFSFEIQILDDKDMRRRFRVSNFQSTTKVRPFCTTMPIGLSAGWNQVQFNLADFTKRAYGSAYMETVRVQIHANVRIRRIYFTDQLHSDEELPNEFKLFAPGPRDQKGGKGKEKKPSKEALGEPSVPPIKTEPRPEEEIPPPPSPAEESPVVQEELKEEPKEEPKEEDGEPVAAPEGEGEAQPIPEGQVEEGEASPEVATGEPIPAEEGQAVPEGEVEGAPPVEGGEPPAEGESPPVEGGEPVPEGEVVQSGEAVVESEAPPTEGEEPHVEGEEIKAEAPAEEVEEAHVEAEADTGEVVEVKAEATEEVVESVAEVTVTETTTEGTEVTDTEGSPSEPPATDEGEA